MPPGIYAVAQQAEVRMQTAFMDEQNGDQTTFDINSY